MGEIITFYSFKGGTGRSMALANVASSTAMRESGKKILMIDWDLEAPGLEHYFQKYINPYELKDKEGIFDLVKKANKQLPKMPYGEENREKLNAFFNELQSYLVKIDLPYTSSELWLLKSGKQTSDYSEQLNKFNWESFYKRIPAFFTLFSEYLSSHFDFVFIDARTGHTGIGGISTMLMPEKLVLVFTPNQQGLDGLVKVAQKATTYRMNSGDLRPLAIYPLPSRVDERAVKNREEWRDKYERIFTELFQEIYALPASISLKSYFDKVQIPHSSEYAYGEKVAVLEETNTINAISENYRVFTHQLLNMEKIWENKPFSDLEKPFQIFLVFTEQDRAIIEELNKHLKALERQKIIYLKSESKNYLSTKQWDSVIKRNLAEENYDLVVIFVSNSFLDEKEEWNDYIKFNTFSDNKIFINIDLKDIPEELTSFPLTPSRRKGIRELENKDEVWVKIVTDIRNKLIQHYGKSRKSKAVA